MPAEELHPCNSAGRINPTFACGPTRQIPGTRFASASRGRQEALPEGSGPPQPLTALLSGPGHGDGARLASPPGLQLPDISLLQSPASSALPPPRQGARPPAPPAFPSPPLSPERLGATEHARRAGGACAVRARAAARGGLRSRRGAAQRSGRVTAAAPSGR